jgi:hypothetical protein
VKLDWDAMIGTLALNGRLHDVGAGWNRSRSRHSHSSWGSVAFQVRRLAAGGDREDARLCFTAQMSPQTEHFPMSKINGPLPD